MMARVILSLKNANLIHQKMFFEGKIIILKRERLILEIFRECTESGLIYY